MPIQMTNHAPGMTAEVYDEVMTHAAAPMRAAPGFIAHAAQVRDDGVTVTEVWESEEDWRRWFDTAVRPHLPEGAPDPQVAGLHRVVAP